MLAFSIALVLLVIVLLVVKFLPDKRYPASFTPDKTGKWGTTAPFWSRHQKDGQLIANPEFTDDGGKTLNEKGMIMMKYCKEQDRYFGSNKRPRD
jgi:hypothetical protein